MALVVRFATPLEGRGREVSLGAEWQPTRLPIRLATERRISLDGERGGEAVSMIGGVGPVAIEGMWLDIYGQAGAIQRRTAAGFADGSVLLEKRIAQRHRGSVSIGGGAWGGIQPGASRLDIGPTVAVRLPVAGHTLRMALDWRERVAGEARPGSGLAVVMGADF